MLAHRRNVSRRATTRIAAFAVVLGVLVPARLAPAQCLPSFPDSGGWLGGDVGGSIPLGGGRVLWVFGDSFIGERAQRTATRAGSRMVANTVAISTCPDGKWNIQYYFGNDSGSPAAFFDSHTSKYKYWPLDGFVHRGSLYLFLLDIVTTGSGVFDFKQTGVTLARVSNLQTEPPQWKTEYRGVVSGSSLVPGVSTVLAPPWVYVFANLEPGHDVILARIALERLESPSSSIEYLARDGNWKRGLRGPDARAIVSPGTPDFSVRYHPSIARWMMVQTDPAFPASRVGFRTAERLEGPWSGFGPLLDIPEAADAARKRELFCYAAKEHPEFAPSAASLSVTYACNSFSFKRLVEDLSIYRPRAVTLGLPQARDGRARQASSGGRANQRLDGSNT